MKTMIAGVFVVVNLLGCARGPVSSLGPGVAVPLTRFNNEPSSFLDYSSLNTSARMVIGDQLAWRAVWDALYKGKSDVPLLPEVDFSREQVLVAALGERGSSGYSIVFQGASANDSGGVDVVVQSSSPGKNCASLTVLTQPVDIARIPRVSGAIHFVERAHVSDCGQ